MISDSATGEIKHDPNFIELNFVSVKYHKGTYQKSFGGMHPCTEDEIRKFAKPIKSASDIFEVYKQNKNMMCHNDLDYNNQPVF